MHCIYTYKYLTTLQILRIYFFGYMYKIFIIKNLILQYERTKMAGKEMQLLKGGIYGSH